MANYDYTQDRVTLGGDTSDNNATGLGGYSLDVSPNGSWPGLSADPNKQRLDTDAMMSVAQSIDNYVQALQNSGHTEIQGKAAVSYGPDSWGAAVYLKDASSQVATTVSQYTSELITNLTAASGAIRKAAGQYSGAESTNQQSASNQQNSLDGSRSSTGY
ncbi:MAG: hypothetical protein ABI808_05615 [Pseudonocardiales bacterium]